MSENKEEIFDQIEQTTEDKNLETQYDKLNKKKESLIQEIDSLTDAFQITKEKDEKDQQMV